MDSSHHPGMSELLDEATKYLELFHAETDQLDRLGERLAQVFSEIRETGTYTQTFEELQHGARVAWRNSNKCVGRHYWPSLELLDYRSLSRVEEIYEVLVDYLDRATCEGRIRPTIVAFAPTRPGEPGIRIWNEQLIRYAGYRQADGSVVGDPRCCEITEIARNLGWRGGEGGRFDILPWILQMPGEAPRVFEIPRQVILEVPLVHPDYPWFADLDLKWHALPAISSMRLEVGGLSYTAAPFNGWYMGTEIGARNLGDVGRYNMLPIVAEKMGLDTRREQTLWRDRALVELNVAVLFSYAEAGVRIVDHHTCTRQFVTFEGREVKEGRPVNADWGWIVPPLSASGTPVFHRSYDNVIEKPNFFYQDSPWSQIFLDEVSEEAGDGGRTGDEGRAAVRGGCPFGHGNLPAGREEPDAAEPTL